MPTERQLSDGSWVEDEGIGPQGFVARLEFFLRDRNIFPKFANLLGRFNERGLGR